MDERVSEALSAFEKLLCGGTLRVIACIDTPEVIDKILTHLAARKASCNDRPRAPPLNAPQAQPPASPSLPPS